MHWAMRPVPGYAGTTGALLYLDPGPVMRPGQVPGVHMGMRFFLYVLSGLLALAVFGVLFKLLQNERAYQGTLGKVSRNYVRSGGWDDYVIKQESVPYVALTNESILSWDAPIYQCLSKDMYRLENGCYSNVRSAFFPLFPLLWKVTHSTPIGMALLNYFIFLLSVSLLAIHLMPGHGLDRTLAFALLVTVPSTIIYHIPYSEALFLLTMTIAVVGLIKGRYWIFFLGAFLTAMVRPATAFILIAFLAADAIALLRGSGFRPFIRNALLHGLPFLAGYITVFLIQYLYSGSWDIMREAQQYWAGGPRRFTSISDWSVEGFGMNSFAIFFIALPAAAFTLFSLVRPRRGQAEARERPMEDYLLLVSAIYMAGLLLFTVLTSGGNLHGFFRFTMATPLFYIGAFILLGRSREVRPAAIAIVLGILSTLLFSFLQVVEYGGDRSQFAFLGLYLLVASFLFLGLGHKLPRPAKLPICLMIVSGNILWNTYLFNIFLSNGWIFT